jgi:pilus assembly protein CpaC
MRTTSNFLHFTFIFILALPAWAQTSVFIKPGHQQVIEREGITKASIGDPRIASLNDPGNGRQIIVTGKRAGQTNLLVWTEDQQKHSYTIIVETQSQSTISEIRRLLGGIEGIQIDQVGGFILIDGQLYRGEDLELVQRISQLYKNVKNYTKVSPKALTFLKKIVEEKLASQGMTQVSVHSAGDTLYLKGFVTSAMDQERALKIAQNIYFQTQSHLRMGVQVENQIWVDLKFMEVMSDKLDDIGFGWPEAIDVQGQFSTSQFRSATSNISAAGNVTLKTLVKRGQAKVLSNPKLLVRNGKTATFDAGGELPIRLVSERTANVVFKSYGLHIEIDATADASNKVFLDIRSRISDLDLSTEIDGLPSIVEHKVNTAVDLEYGQTVALAGLIEARQSKATKKFPFLGHIPILGELFKSRNFRNNQSEFVMFLTPHNGNADRPLHLYEEQNMHDRFKEMDEKLKFSILD